MLYNNGITNFLEINYTTPTGSRGCYRFLVNTNEYISTSFFAVKPQTALKQVFEAVTWSSDAAENFRAIKEFYLKTIENMKKHSWFLFIENERKKIDKKIENEKQHIKNRKQSWRPALVKNTATKNIKEYQEQKENLKKEYATFLKSFSKERKALERLEKNYNYFLKFIEKLNSKKRNRRRAA